MWGRSNVLLKDIATGDNMYPKITSLLEDQSRGAGVNRGTSSQFPESTKTLSGIQLVIGSLLFLNKTAPSPQFRINPYLNYDIYTGRVKIDDETALMVNTLNNLLRGKTENTNAQALTEEDDLMIMANADSE